MLAQHTLGHVDCPACEETKRATMFSQNLGEQLFPEAARLWLLSRRKLSATTLFHYEDYIKSLSQFFELMKLRDIHIGHVVAYQRSRQAQIRASKQHAARKRGRDRDESDGASRINHEISCIVRQVLRRAGLWEAIAKFYEPLPLPKDSVGIALTPEEEEHWFNTARSRPRWMIAYCCDLLSRNTTAGPGEIRYLRLKNIDMENSVIHVEEGVKNDFRVRPLPLNTDAKWAMRWLLERYRQMCHDHGIAPSPEHYLLPHRAGRRGAAPDPTRPMGSWKKAHYAIRAEAAKRFPRLAQVRRYDFRHTACTDLLEDPTVSYTTIEHMMGHRLTSNTKRKYDHLRNSALRAAGEALNHGYAQPPRKEPEPAERGREEEILAQVGW